MKTHEPSSTSVDSTRNLWIQMCAAIEKPTAAPRSLLNACVTQVALSKYCWSEKKINALSLNTLKGAADKVVEPGGWEALNDIRKKLYVASLTCTHAAKKTRRGFGFRLAKVSEELEASQSRIQKLLRSRVVLLQAYSDIIDILRAYRTLDAQLDARLRNHEVMFDIGLFADVEATHENT
ncbi:hypothetical protein [Caballeronia sp. J97]|uniref:hypothetical protein n=1 Tax=Caballeronia sp. J97 TaxID=2805429 RepID=UPI002AB1E3C8|nr:hypothetical protein [Caballeronia sp. J97]